MGKNFGIIFCFLSLLLPSRLVSQNFDDNYQPVAYSRIPKELIHSYAYKFGQWGQHNTLVSNKAKSEFVKFAGEKVKFIATLDSAKLLMHDDSISVYLNRIKDEIIRSNAHLENYDCKVFTYRSLEPNAYSLGEGIILFSLGLLASLDTREQVASIIAHEMSHDILNHVFLSNQRFYRELYDSGFRKTLRQVSRTSIGRKTEVKKLTDGFLQQHFGYRRSEEITADSLGFILFTNSGFKGREFIHALEHLDEAEELKYQDALRLENIFHFSNLSFNPEWLDPTNAGSEWEADSSLTMEQDSFQTHPDCKIRIENIRRLSGDLGIAVDKEETGKPLPGNIVNAVAFESLGSVMLAQDYAVGLFVSLHLLEKFPENMYLKTVTAHCLVELYLSFRNNEYLDYVQFENAAFPAGYNHLLSFLHNMTSATLKGIFDSYMAERLPGVDNSYIAFLQLLGSSGDKINYDDIYAFEQKFNDPYLSKLLKDKWTASQ